MGCPFEITLLNYVEGNLAGKKREKVYNHLLDCRDCLEALAQVQRMPSREEWDKLEGPRREIVEKVKGSADSKRKR